MIESTRSIGDPRGLDRLESIYRRYRGFLRGDPLGLDRLEVDRGSLRGDPLGLDRIDSIDRGSLRARSIDHQHHHHHHHRHHHQCQVFRLAAAGGWRRRPPAARIGETAAHCCGIFSCTKPSVGAVGGERVAAETAFLALLHHIMLIHCFSMLFDVFQLLWMVLDGFRRVWKLSLIHI